MKDSEKKTGEIKPGAGAAPANDAPVKWRVRSPSGDIFGPADRPTLLSWAREGRIGPEHSLSADGETWTLAPRMKELAMDWLVELEPGAFFGPGNLDHLQNMMREGEIASDARFYRCSSPEQIEDDRDSDGLRTRMTEQQRIFDEKMGQAEENAYGLQSEMENLKAALQAKDLEFDAERQEFKAYRARVEADRMKGRASLDSLNREIQSLRQAIKGKHALEARFSDLETQAAGERKRLREECDHLRDKLGRSAAEATRLRKEQLSLQEASALLEKRLAEATDDLRRQLERSQVRERSAGKLLRQALSALDDGSEETPGPATPVVKDAAREAPSSLAGIEAQAQRELSRLQANGIALKTIFSGGKAAASKR